MKSPEQLRQFFEEKLLDDLRVLEARRKSVLNKISITAGIVGVIALLFAIILTVQTRSPVGFIIPLVSAAVIIGLASRFISKGYVSDFKHIVIGGIVKFLGDDLNYEPNGFIEKHIFMMSKIFTTGPNVYKGDDLVWGNIGATRIRFSELNAVHESGSGKNRHRVTIFRGLFFTGDFNKDFKGKTIVLPDTAEALFSRLGSKLQAMNIFRGQLIKLEDPQFERQFVVYGDDQVEARYILSPSLMSRIVDYKQKSGKKICLSFVGSMVFVAIWISRNLFEPKIFNTLLDFEPIRQYYEDLRLAADIVEDLNLNVRIWSRQ
jgi:hypothetical protein